MGLNFKNIAKAAVATAAAGAAVKVLSGTNPAAGIQSAISSIGNSVNNLASNLNSSINNALSIPGFSGLNLANLNISSFDFSAGNFISLINPNNSEEGEIAVYDQDPPFPNELHNYASYNYIWTLSGLSRNHLNFPDDSYRKGILGPIILKSGSGDPDNRISLEDYASSANPSGKFEYFIDNVRITGVTGLDKVTGNTNSTGITFNVIEPYSIGLFFGAIETCSRQLKYSNWVEMPLLLSLEFTGHEDTRFQNVFHTVQKKYFPLKIMQIQMRVTEKGAVYECTAVPWNERAYSRQISTIKSDVTCTGRTVQEMLQKDGPNNSRSFQTIVNDSLASQAVAMSQGKEPIVPDRILILFPIETATGTGSYGDIDSSSPAGATTSGLNNNSDQGVAEKLGVELEGINYVQNTNISPIGLADMGFIDQKKAEAVFGKEGTVYDPDKKVFVRGNVTISSKEGLATFKQGQTIPNIINQIILSSDYGRQALDPNNFDEQGYINWWRITTQMYLLEGENNMSQTGKYPFLTVYRVIPHKVHHSRFMQTDQKPKSEEVKNTVVKRYDYLYTSKNIDILDFQIDFNAGFYTSLPADSGRFNKDIQTRNQTASDATPSKPIIENGKLSSHRIDSNGNKYDASSEYASGMHGNYRVGDTLSQLVQIRNAEIDIGANQGGTAGEDPGRIAARSFHKAINSMAEMCNLNMKILGDPFYLGDSGMGNYTAPASNVRGATADKSINYQRGEVYIEVNFRNPIDINHLTGHYDFPSAETLPAFSGLYRVGTVESTFNRGTFTQSLQLQRMQNQQIKASPTSRPDTAAGDLNNNFKPGDSIDRVEYEGDESGEWT
ncbi:MAG: hypothetical protein EBT86_00695 [Actinobacteria bacterium]|nr:hypothetical protein [Actinomycetota bacterium]